jgi:hypothetical protein
MATFRRRGTIGRLERKMIDRMTTRGYQRVFAERCFNQIKGFGEYGFPESHAASFAHSGLRVELAQVPLPGGVLRRHSQLPADGVLCARRSWCGTPANMASRCMRRM